MAGSKILEGKLSLVTGGGSGIGRAICQVFAREGATVIVANRNESSGQETVRELSGNGNHTYFLVNVADSASVNKLFQDIRQQYKRSPDIVVNNAGIIGNPANVVDSIESDFDNVIGINLKGTYLVTREAIKGMLENNTSTGSVVNLSSIAGKAGLPTTSFYSASKAGMVAFTKSVAKEVAANGIRCNAVLPGMIDTPLFSNYNQHLEAHLMAETMVPIKRIGDPHEVAELCAFLGSERSSYMTGAAVEVTGGWLM